MRMESKPDDKPELSLEEREKLSARLLNLEQHINNYGGLTGSECLREKREANEIYEKLGIDKEYVEVGITPWEKSHVKKVHRLPEKDPI